LNTIEKAHVQRWKLLQSTGSFDIYKFQHLSK